MSYAWRVVLAGPPRLRRRRTEGYGVLDRARRSGGDRWPLCHICLLDAATMARRAEATARRLSAGRHREDSKTRSRIQLSKTRAFRLPLRDAVLVH
jgi:hypothetical protein